MDEDQDFYYVLSNGIKYNIPKKDVKVSEYTAKDNDSYEQAQAEKEYATINSMSGVGRIQPAPLTNRDVKPLDKITLDLSKGIAKKFYYTKQPSATRGSLGSYNSRTTALKIKFRNDLDTIAHEIGHSLDNMFGLRNIAENNPAIISELTDLGQHGSKPPKDATYIQKMDYVKEASAS